MWRKSLIKYPSTHRQDAYFESAYILVTFVMNQYASFKKVALKLLNSTVSLLFALVFFFFSFVVWQWLMRRLRSHSRCSKVLRNAAKPSDLGTGVYRRSNSAQLHFDPENRMAFS